MHHSGEDVIWRFKARIWDFWFSELSRHVTAWKRGEEVLIPLCLSWNGWTLKADNSGSFLSDLKCSRWCSRYKEWVIYLEHLHLSNSLKHNKYHIMPEASYLLYAWYRILFKPAFSYSILMRHILSHSLYLDNIVSTFLSTLNVTGICVTSIHGTAYSWERWQSSNWKLKSKEKYSLWRTRVREPSERKVFWQEKLWIRDKS